VALALVKRGQLAGPCCTAIHASTPLPNQIFVELCIILYIHIAIHALASHQCHTHQSVSQSVSHCHYTCRYNTEHDAPYWRGQIWININYLCLKALKHYAQVDGPGKSAAEQLHRELRANLLSNLVDQYNVTGYLWEQYDDTDGKPKGSHPFTGWTALVALIASDV